MGEAIPVIGLALSALGSGWSAVNSADAAGQANQIAQNQQNQETDLINQAKTQQANQNAQDQQAVATSAAASAIKQMTGKKQGLAGTVLTSPQGGNDFTPGKTLLG